MQEQIKYWDAIIKEYKASGLSQPAFCKQNGLSLNQFHYRWAQHNLAKQAEKKTFILDNNAVVNSFEPITITPSFSAPKEESNRMSELVIHLPNRIRCDVKMDLRTESFATLLKQLVALC